MIEECKQLLPPGTKVLFPLKEDEEPPKGWIRSKEQPFTYDRVDKQMIICEKVEQ